MSQALISLTERERCYLTFLTGLKSLDALLEKKILKSLVQRFKASEAC